MVANNLLPLVQVGRAAAAAPVRAAARCAAARAVGRLLRRTPVGRHRAGRRRGRRPLAGRRRRPCRLRRGRLAAARPPRARRLQPASSSEEDRVDHRLHQGVPGRRAPSRSTSTSPTRRTATRRGSTSGSAPTCAGWSTREFGHAAPVQHDFACGTGRAIRTLHGLVRDAHGYDTSAEMMAKAAEVGSQARAGTRCRRTARCRSPVPAGRPAIVTMFRLLLNVRRRRPRPGDRVRRARRCPSADSGAAGGGEPRQRRLAAAPARPAAPRRALVRRALPRARSTSCSTGTASRSSSGAASRCSTQSLHGNPAGPRRRRGGAAAAGHATAYAVNVLYTARRMSTAWPALAACRRPAAAGRLHLRPDGDRRSPTPSPDLTSRAGRRRGQPGPVPGRAGPGAAGRAPSSAPGSSRTRSPTPGRVAAVDGLRGATWAGGCDIVNTYRRFEQMVGTASRTRSSWPRARR